MTVLQGIAIDISLTAANVNMRCHVFGIALDLIDLRNVTDTPI